MVPPASKNLHEANSSLTGRQPGLQHALPQGDADAILGRNLRMADADKRHPADLADELERLPPEEAQARLRTLAPAEAAAVVQELDDELRPRLLEGLSEKELSDLLGSLP